MYYSCNSSGYMMGSKCIFPQSFSISTRLPGRGCWAGNASMRIAQLDLCVPVSLTATFPRKPYALSVHQSQWEASFVSEAHYQSFCNEWPIMQPERSQIGFWPVVQLLKSITCSFRAEHEAETTLSCVPSRTIL